MKLAIIFVCLFVLLAISAVGDAQDMAKFEEFKNRHKKKYSNAAASTTRFQRWKQLKNIVDQHNQAAKNGKNSFVLDDNHLSDMTEQEWKTNLLGISVSNISNLNEDATIFKPVDSVENASNIDRQQAITSIDWRTHPCLPPIKTQSPCGGCWAFVATTSIEFQTCIANGNVSSAPLSEQQLIDCSGNYGTKGCNGGFYSNAWDYTLAVGGQTLNSSYPYKGVNGTCLFTKGITPIIGKVLKYTALTKLNETSMLIALQKGPVSVSVVTNSKFMLYSSGIFDDDTCKNGTVNHGVVVVGRNVVNGTDYWIVRNSWGTSWGQKGYIFMKRNVNICRIAEYAYIATP